MQNMDANKKGYVYILTNPSFKEDWIKIGKSSRSVNVRSKELDNTAVPLPFEIYATLQTSKYNEVEKLVHKTIDRLTDLRIRQNREFFNVAPEVALDILKDIAQTLDDAVIDEVYKKDKHLIDEDGDSSTDNQDCHSTQPAFKFTMVGLKPGDEIVFDPTGVKVTIKTDKQIEYNGRLWSLSAFTAEHLPESQQNTSGSYQGTKYFSYNGKTMLQLRKESGNW